MRSSAFFTAFLLFLTLITLKPSPSQASQELRFLLAEIAADVQKLLDGQGEDSVAMGEFTGPATFPTSSGPGIEELLSRELEGVKLQVKTRAKFGIKGAYRPIELPANKSFGEDLGRKILASEIEVKVVDQFDKPLGDLVFKRQVLSESIFAQLMGCTVALSTGGVQISEETRDEELRQAILNPNATLSGSLIQTRPDSPYAMEIRVFGQPRFATLEDGLPFVHIKRGEEYTVRLVNRSTSDAAVRLQIDGLSMYTFSEVKKPDGTSYSTVIIPAETDVIISGWHITNQHSDKFLVTEYAKSATASLNHSTKIGTITATFHAAWENEPPPDEPSLVRSRSPDATGRGERIEQRYVEVNRHIGVVREIISVRYTKPE